MSLATILNRDDTPGHLFEIPELDFSGDLFAERPTGPWFRLGAWTTTGRPDERGVEDVIDRQSLLLHPGHFQQVFDKLESIGNVIDHMGKPGGSTYWEGDQKTYRFLPFHHFEFLFTRVAGEPLVFTYHTTSGTHLLINPDLWLFFGLEERTPGNGIWWDPERGVDTILRRVTDDGNLQFVDIRVDYLLRYLKARQMSLVVAHYRHLHLFDPPKSTIQKFVEGDIVLGSPQQGAKALLQNWGIRRDIPHTPPFLQRRLHLWFEIRPSRIDIADPWADEPPFDPYEFTLPTRVGLVAPARWRHFRQTEGRTFEGETCDFMDRVCFRQEVLMKYERASGFDVEDDGSVSCHHYWGLRRGVARIGNELLSAAIGDFAQGVPFEEWPHWGQYAIEPPSSESVKAIRQEQSVRNAVNGLANALAELNVAFARLADSFGVKTLEHLWCGSLDSLAGRQLKWVYPATADDNEFLKRATLASTFVFDALETRILRKFLRAIDPSLHMNNEDPPKELGSRNLLRRVSFIAVLISELYPQTSRISPLVRQGESNAENAEQPDLQQELQALFRRVQREFAALAFLYELRVCGGLAHAQNKNQAAKAANRLGLPPNRWHRTDYLRLLNLITESIQRISCHLETAIHAR